MTDMTPIRSAAGQFLPGRSGNPAGRPRGSRNRSSLLAEMIDEAEHDAIVRLVVERALAGEWAAQRACFTRLLAPAREAPVEIALPPIASAEDAAEAGLTLIASVAAGAITAREAEAVMKLLTAQIRLLAAAATPASDPAAVDGARATRRRDAAGESRAQRAGACISPVPAAARAAREPGRGAPDPSRAILAPAAIAAPRGPAAARAPGVFSSRVAAPGDSENAENEEKGSNRRFHPIAGCYRSAAGDSPCISPVLAGVTPPRRAARFASTGRDALVAGLAGLSPLPARPFPTARDCGTPAPSAPRVGTGPSRRDDGRRPAAPAREAEAPRRTIAPGCRLAEA